MCFGLGCVQLGQRVFDASHNRVKPGRIVNRHFRKRLTIQLDTRGMQPMNELAVTEFAQRRRPRR